MLQLQKKPNEQTRSAKRGRCGLCPYKNSENLQSNKFDGYKKLCVNKKHKLIGAYKYVSNVNTKINK